jgi:hypothetical protein
MSFLDFLNTTGILITSGLVTAAFLGLFFARVPEKLASERGYKGGLRMFALDTNIKPNEVNTMLAAYGAIGRRELILAHLLFDFAFPVAYTLFLVAAAGLFAPSSLRNWGRVVPFVAGLSDCLENIGIISLAATFPARLVVAERSTTALTVLKWALLGLSALMVGAGAISWLLG